MVKLLLVIAAIADVALAALLVGVSGFLFGSGPECTPERWRRLPMLPR